MPHLQTEQRTEAVTSTQSLTLIRNLFRTSISTICYIRNLFPESCFTTRTVVGLNIKSLTPTTADVATLITWLENGVFDTLAKGYLDELTFGILTDPKDVTSSVEEYVFRIGYDAISLNGTQVITKGRVKEDSVRLLRRLIAITETLGPLPEKRYLFVRLKYNKTTPKDFQPQFFKDITGPVRQSQAQMRLGKVDTGHHALDLSMVAQEEDLVPQKKAPLDVEKEVPSPKSIGLRSLVVQELRGGPRTLEELVASTSAGRPDVERVLSSLERTGQVTCDAGVFRLV